METIANIIDLHRQQPDVSLKKYVTKKQLELGIKVKSKYRIYLDLRFWILLRDVELSRNDNKNLIQLLYRIKSLVDGGEAICPISETVFVELMKQSDCKTRPATAKLIDRLSLGVTLVCRTERINQELCNFIYSLVGTEDLIPIDALVWTKLSYILGEHHPHQTPFNSTEELIIQKSFFDRMWDVTLTEIVNYIGVESLTQIDWQEAVKMLNTVSDYQ